MIGEFPGARKKGGRNRPSRAEPGSCPRSRNGKLGRGQRPGTTIGECDFHVNKVRWEAFHFVHFILRSWGRYLSLICSKWDVYIYNSDIYHRNNLKKQYIVVLVSPISWNLPRFLGLVSFVSANFVRSVHNMFKNNKYRESSYPLPRK